MSVNSINSSGYTETTQVSSKDLETKGEGSLKRTGRPRARTIDSGTFVKYCLGLRAEKEEEQSRVLRHTLSVSSIEISISPGTSPPRRLHLPLKRSHEKTASADKQLLKELEEYALKKKYPPQKAAEHFAKQRNEAKKIGFWTQHLEQVEKISQASKKLDERVVSLKPPFDKDYPLPETSWENVRDAFRAFFCESADTTAPFFRFNQTPLTLPQDLVKASDIERPVKFMTWLIEKIESKLPYTSKLTVKDQARLICRGPIKREERDALAEKLHQSLAQGEAVNFELLKSRLKGEDFPKSFRRWARDHLADYLYLNSEQALGDRVEEIISRYESDYSLKFLKKSIPSYRLLQSLSFRAFSYFENDLRSTRFPSLLTQQGEGLPLMKSFPQDPTFFLIDIEKNTGQYRATQVKIFRLVTKTGESIEDVTLLGKAEVHCTMRGNIASEKREAHYRIRNLEFEPGESLELRRRTMQAMGYLN